MMSRINRFRTWLAWKILPESYLKDITIKVYHGGWSSSQAIRCFKFCEDALRAQGRACHSLFKLIYGKEVKFELVNGGMSSDMYNANNPIFERLKKSSEFTGKSVKVPI